MSVDDVRLRSYQVERCGGEANSSDIDATLPSAHPAERHQILRQQTTTHIQNRYPRADIASRVYPIMQPHRQARCNSQNNDKQ